MRALQGSTARAASSSSSRHAAATPAVASGRAAAAAAQFSSTSSLWPAQQHVLRPATQQQQQCRQRTPAASLARGQRRTVASCTASPAAGVQPPAAQQQAPQQQQSGAAGGDAQQLQQLRSRLQLHNSMSRRKEVFTPRPGMGDRVQMYVCGVTVYDYSHIGHARVYTAFDVLYRLLRHLRYDVQYVRNFTDVDDKIIARAAQSGEDPLALSARFITEFHVDMAALGCLPPTLEPRATDHVPDMVATISRIIDNGHAYALPDGDVYFDVASLPGYGRLSGRSAQDNRAGERVAVDERKRGAADFALWKAAKAGEPQWPSPWGPGRPGWHIECSSMISALMGDLIDIHGGGRDLIFPHHENELAQSQAACGCGQPHPHQHQDGSAAAAEPDASFVRYWLHNGFVNVESEKMSKSLGNFFTIRDVLALYHPAALRWFLVAAQYRAPLNYTQRGLEEASDRVFYVFSTLADVGAALREAGEAGAAAAAAAAGGGSSAGGAPAPAAAASKGSDKGAAAAAAAAAAAGAEVVDGVLAGLLDDLNTPASVAVLSGPLKAVNDLLTTKAGRKNPNRLQLLAAYQHGLLSGLELLGLAPPDLQSTLGELRRLALARAGMTEQEVAEAIAARAAARAGKDFAAADAVRLRLASKGIMLMDAASGGTTWRPGMPEGVQADADGGGSSSS